MYKYHRKEYKDGENVIPVLKMFTCILDVPFQKVSNSRSFDVVESGHMWGSWDAFPGREVVLFVFNLFINEQIGKSLFHICTLEISKSLGTKSWVHSKNYN